MSEMKSQFSFGDKTQISAMFVFLVLTLVLISYVVISAGNIIVTLVAPQNESTDDDGIIEFISNLTDDFEIVNATLYTNISGWAAEETRWNGEIPYNDTGLVLLLHLNNESAFGENDTHVYDWSGNGNNGTFQGNPEYNASGVFGGMLELSGSGDYIMIPNGMNTLMNNLYNWTLQMWIYPTSDERNLLGTSAGGEFWIWVGDNYDIGFDQYFGMDPSYVENVSSTPDYAVQPDQWNHLIITRNVTDFRIYRDGQFFANLTSTETKNGNYGTDMQIGRYDSSSSNDFQGYMDEVAIWNRTLSSSEIQDLYSYTKTSFYPVFQNKTVNEGSYVWNVLAFDNDSSSDWSESNYTFTYDSSGPTIQLPFYTNATKKNSSDSLTLNMSVSDSLTQPDTCLVYVAGQSSNQTLSYSNGWCNGSISLMDSNPGNSTIYTYANDTLNNWGLNDSYVVWIAGAPVTPTPEINSTDGTNHSSQDLNCFDTITDPDSDNLNVTVHWHMNGVFNVSYDYNDSYSSGYDFVSTLGSGNTSVGQRWSCSLRLFDGKNYSNWGNSSNLTIISESDNLIVVSLTSPDDDSTGTDGIITFISNVTDDNEVINATLYTNISGPWTAEETRWNGEIPYNDTGLVLLLHLNNESDFGENDGLFYDWSGNGNNATGTDMNYSAGKFGFGLYGEGGDDGTKDFPVVTQTASLNVTNLTIMVWVKMNSLSKDNSLVANDWWGQGDGYGLYWDAADEDFIWDPRNGTMYCGALLSDSVSVQEGTWYHVAVTHNRTSARIYLNGTEVGSYDDYDCIIGYDDSDTYIASYNNWNSYLNGSIDEVAIFNRTLSQSEIQDIYNYTKTIFYPVFQNKTVNEGSYVWNVLAFDNDSSSDWSESNYTFTYDSSGPTIQLPFYTNATKKSGMDPLTLNVSVSDSITQPDTCLVYVSGQSSNQTLSYSSGWCNGSISLTDSNPGNSTIYAYANDSANNWGLNDSYVVWIDNTGENSWLEVELITPLEGLNVPQNTTFTVNATVYCRNETCGNITGTVRYNESSANPDTIISTTSGDNPFYIISEDNPQNCSTNPLEEDEYCNITWTVNATGTIGSNYEIGVLFQSNYTGVSVNYTGNNTVEIADCFIDISLYWSAVSFGSLIPGERGNASGNDNDEYNITIESTTSCNIDLYINGTDIENTSLGYTIGVGNVSWNNVSNDYASSYSLSNSWNPVKKVVPPSTNTTTWYWLDMPCCIASGFYEGSVEIMGIKTGESP